MYVLLNPNGIMNLYYWTISEIETYKVSKNLIGLVAKQKCTVV